MKTTVLAIALAFATMPLTFAQAPKTDTSKTSKPAKKHDTSKKAPTKSGGTSNNTSTTTPVKK